MLSPWATSSPVKVKAEGKLCGNAFLLQGGDRLIALILENTDLPLPGLAVKQYANLRIRQARRLCEAITSLAG